MSPSVLLSNERNVVVAMTEEQCEETNRMDNQDGELKGSDSNVSSGRSTPLQRPQIVRDSTPTATVLGTPEMGSLNNSEKDLSARVRVGSPAMGKSIRSLSRADFSLSSQVGLSPLRSGDITASRVLANTGLELPGPDQLEFFKQIEEDYHQTMRETENDPNVEKFREIYTKVYEMFLQGRENETRLVRRCQELQNEVTNQSNQMQASIKLNQNDRAAIINLKKDIKKAWELVEEAKEREEKTNETISQLKSEIAVLQAQVQQNSHAGMDQEQAINELMRQKDELLKERDVQINQILQLRGELSEMMDNIKILESQKMKTQQEIGTLREEIVARKADHEKEVKNKEKVERELRDAKGIIDQRNADVKMKADAINRMRDDASKMEALIREQKIQVEKTAREYEQIQLKATKLQQDYNEQVMITTHLIAQNQEKSDELRNREEEISHIRNEIKTIGRVRDNLQKRLKTVEEQKGSLETEKDQLKTTNHSLEKDIEMLRKEIEIEKRKIEELNREREILNKNVLKSTASTQKQQALLAIQEQIKQGLEQDISLFKEEAVKQRKIIFALEKERDKYVADTSQIQNQLLESIEDLKSKETEIFELKKSIAELETKLRQQQNLYEAVRADRNVYSKNLVEAQDEINEMKQKLKMTAHQIEQLKEEIHSKDNHISKEHQDLQRIEKERDQLKFDLQRLQTHMNSVEEKFQNQQVEEQKLRAILVEAEAELEKRKKDYEAVVQERDILGSQIVRRNDEIALLYEKIKIQQSILNKGESQYRERLEDARVLKMEIQRLNQEKLALLKDSQNVDSLTEDINRLEKNLIAEKSKVRLLEDQLRNPVNIHRWRKLEGSDPEVFELIKKVQNLQKRLILKTEEVVEKELLIQQREKLYEELRQQMNRQPIEDVHQQISVYQKSVREKAEKLKAVTSELKLYHTQVDQYKTEIERLNREISAMKKEFYTQKKHFSSARRRTRTMDMGGLPLHKSMESLKY